MRNRIKSKRTAVEKLLVASSIFMILTTSACGANKEVTEAAGKIVEAVENNDMETIEKIVLGIEKPVVDEGLEDFFVDFKGKSNGIMTKIIEQDSIKVKKITDDYIIYEIMAPELSEMFGVVMEEENLTSDQFEEIIYDYIATADKTKIKVKVPYTYENEVFAADYTTEEFINGITGNLITAYQELIQDLIQESNGGI